MKMSVFDKKVVTQLRNYIFIESDINGKPTKYPPNDRDHKIPPRFFRPARGKISQLFLFEKKDKITPKTRQKTHFDVRAGFERI